MLPLSLTLALCRFIPYLLLWNFFRMDLILGNLDNLLLPNDFLFLNKCLGSTLNIREEHKLWEYNAFKLYIKAGKKGEKNVELEYDFLHHSFRNDNKKL